MFNISTKLTRRDWLCLIGAMAMTQSCGLVVSPHRDTGSVSVNDRVDKTAMVAHAGELSAVPTAKAHLAGGDLPILIDDAAEICDSKQYIDRNGDIQTGAKKCDVDLSNLSSSNLKSGITIDGVTGTVIPESHPNCASDGATGCVTSASFKSADMTVVIPGNIKSGETIAGVSGQYPSATYPLSGASGTADLDAATFNVKIKSATAFEFWDSTGARQTGTGDADISSSNIASGKDIFGTSGTVTTPSAWDLRFGSSVVGPAGTVSGLLKTDCRNGASLAGFDQAGYPKPVTASSATDLITNTGHGYANGAVVKFYGGTLPSPLSTYTKYYVINSAANDFKVSLISGGTAIDLTSNGSTVYAYVENGVIDIWDTIEGTGVGVPSYAGWTSDNICGGISTVVNDTNVWLDVTTTDGVTASTCADTPGNCSIKDKITGHEWHKADATNRNWTTAFTYCDTLTYNGKSDWRLPTQKELMSAYVDGIASTWTTFGSMGNYRHSLTSGNGGSTSLTMSKMKGETANPGKSDQQSVNCVRP